MMVLASIFGGLGVVILSLKIIVGFVAGIPPLFSPVVVSKGIEVYDADTKLVIVMVIVVSVTALTVPLMRSVLE
jgi:hypothetical protein